MFLPFLTALRAHRVPVSLREYLTFLQALRAGLVIYDIDGFYHLARAAMVKNEGHVDRFDRAFASVFSGAEALSLEDVLTALDLPPDWLRREAEKHMTPEERAEIEALGGFEALMETLRKRLKEQQGRHQGGNKWIGTAGTSPFGAHGYNPEGVRIGQDTGRHQRAAKVWDRREFRDLDESAQMGTRAIKVALRRLRRWARDGATEELDMDGTIQATARQGWIDVKTRPERRNAVKVLLLLDVGGSMDPHVRRVEELFSAASAEFRTLRHFYFHNCVYDRLWRHNARRWTEQTPTWDVLHTYGPDWKCIFVGDAAMSPYEVAIPGGANEHWNDEAGEVWLRRCFNHWPGSLWINPVPAGQWEYSTSTRMIREIVGPDRMVPLTLEGLDRGMRVLG